MNLRLKNQESKIFDFFFVFNFCQSVVCARKEGPRDTAELHRTAGNDVLDNKENVKKLQWDRNITLQNANNKPLQKRKCSSV